MDACRLSNLEVSPMKRFWLSVGVAIMVAAIVAAPAAANKDKGGDKGNKFKPKKNDFQPQPPRIIEQPRFVEPLRPDTRLLPRNETLPARVFDQPRAGNSLPQEIRDRLPPGLRDKPDNHPGLANHLR